MTVQPQDVSIVVPAYGEEATIGGVVTGLRSRFPESELIVVDDASPDATGKRAAAAGAKVIRHFENGGYGASLCTGTKAASRPYVLYCDADGQHSTDDVARIIEACADYDMVVGARNEASDAPLARRPGKFILRHFANFLAARKIPDLNSGLRIVKRDLMLRFMHLMPRGFSYSTTSTFAFLKSNCRIRYIPITTRKRTGTSSTVQQLKHGPQTLMLMLRLTVLFDPLRVFLSAAALLALLTLVSLCADLFVSEEPNIGDTTVALGISSLIMFMFGLLCDQVSALRREIHDR